MTLDELKDGTQRILDVATEKFNSLCEKTGIDPDDPALTGEDEENDENSVGGDKNGEGAQGVDATAAVGGDGNAMPIPNEQGAVGGDVGGSALPPAGGDAAAAGMQSPIPPDAGLGAGGEMPLGDESGAASPDDEQKKEEQPQA